jgi:hypothetical protein
MEQLTAYVEKEVSNKLPECFNTDEEEKQGFIWNFSTLIRSLQIPVSELKTVYPLPFKIVAHLVQCRIMDADDPSFKFSLAKLNSPDLYIFFNASKAPNLVMFIPNRHPSALFTKRGFLALAGGKNEKEIKECFIICCTKLLFVLSKIYPERRFQISGFRLFNKVATTKVILHKIYLPGLIDMLRKYKVKVRHEQSSINFCFIKRCIPFQKSITFCVSAQGGVNIMGFRRNYEAAYAICLLSYFLRPNIILSVPDHISTAAQYDKYYKEASRQVDIKRKKTRVKKQKEKMKTLQEWIDASSPPVSHGVSDNLLKMGELFISGSIAAHALSKLVLQLQKGHGGSEHLGDGLVDRSPSPVL